MTTIKRNEFIMVRVSGQEKQAVNILAQQEGMKQSEVMRALIREALEKRGLGTVGPVNPSNQNAESANG